MRNYFTKLFSLAKVPCLCLYTQQPLHRDVFNCKCVLYVTTFGKDGLSKQQHHMTSLPYTNNGAYVIAEAEFKDVTRLQ